MKDSQKNNNYLSDLECFLGGSWPSRKLFSLAVAIFSWPFGESSMHGLNFIGGHPLRKSSLSAKIAKKINLPYLLFLSEFA